MACDDLSDGLGNDPDRTWPSYIVVMGVSGSGKSTIAGGLASKLGGSFLEGDDFHPQSNVDTMAAGHPLTDAMRYPWLEAICTAAKRQFETAGAPVVISCSALKRLYRDVLRSQLEGLTLVYLTGDPALIRQRLEQRRSHFMPASLLKSQLADLEKPDADEHAIEIDVDAPQAAIISSAIAAVAQRAPR